MTDALGSTVPAGWYPDPWGSTSQRWWDGSSWSANLYPQPDAPAPDAPAGPPGSPGSAPAGDDDEYVPAAVRSTYEPASSYRTAAAPTVGSPYPSRRALRELAHPTSDENVALATEDAPMAEPDPGRMPIADTLPPYTQAPEFSPEPTSALPPPVWMDPEESVEPVATAAAPEVPVEPAEPPVVPADVPEVAAVADEAPPSPAEAPVVVAAPTTPPAASFTSSPATDDDWAASLSGWAAVESDSAPPEALPVFGDAPPVSYSQRAMRYQPLHGRTSPVWLIVFMPVLQAVATIGSIFLFPDLTSGRQLSAAASMDVVIPLLLSVRDWLLFAALPLSIAFFAFTFVLGFQDRARLWLLGHEQTASPWWMLLSPLVYLIVRSVRVRQCTGRRGSGPLTTFVCLYIAPPIAIIVASVVSSALYGAIPA